MTFESLILLHFYFCLTFVSFVSFEVSPPLASIARQGKWTGTLKICDPEPQLGIADPAELNREDARISRQSYLSPAQASFIPAAISSGVMSLMCVASDQL